MLVFLGRPTAKAGRPSVMIVNVDLFVSGLAATDFVVAAFRGVDFFLVDFFAVDFFVVDFFVAGFFAGDFFFMFQGPFVHCLRISPMSQAHAPRPPAFAKATAWQADPWHAVALAKAARSSIDSLSSRFAL